ncbi:hypothetical protein [Rhizobium leguminosarum]|uniref:hypothetical protein n=1 Tax=Rhizobium leguminosarum TaxID=384 RepID=UPI000488E825|nr:hypothetical protein [Rhizobium leguminosarum]
MQAISRLCLHPFVEGRLLQHGHFVFATGDKSFKIRPPTTRVSSFLISLLCNGLARDEAEDYVQDHAVGMTLQYLRERNLVCDIGADQGIWRAENTTEISKKGVQSTDAGVLAWHLQDEIDWSSLEDIAGKSVSVIVTGIYSLNDACTRSKQALEDDELVIFAAVEQDLLRIGPMVGRGRCGCEICLYWRRIASARGNPNKLPAKLQRAPALDLSRIHHVAYHAGRAILHAARSNASVSWLNVNDYTSQQGSIIPLSNCFDCLAAANKRFGDANGFERFAR